MMVVVVVVVVTVNSILLLPWAKVSTFLVPFTQAAGLKINENQYIDWGSDIGYLKCWRSISDNLRGYIKKSNTMLFTSYTYTLKLIYLF